MPPRRCPTCDVVVRPMLTPWLARCPSCGLWTATDPAPAPVGARRPAVDEDQRAAALEPLRQENFRDLIAILGEVRPLRDARLLDVGCAHGWFIELAAAHGVHAAGLEPDAPVAAQARARGVPVRVGLFPQDVDATERYDVIVFNDVFEHLPDPEGVLAACRERLTPHGLLVLNLPDSRGALYRTACLLARIGFTRPLVRLWQREFPSPHLYYFDAANLERLVSRYGFTLRRQDRLATMRLSGLWPRLVMDPSVSRVGATITWIALALAYPFVTWVMPPDILLQVYARRD